MEPITDSELFKELGLVRPPEPRDDKLDQNEFLELMTAQLRNQNPLKPLESAEFLGQLAQFGTVSGIGDLQTAFQELSTALVSSQALQAGGLVGRSVLAPSQFAELGAGQSLQGAVELDAPATDVQIDIIGPSGELVRRLHLGAQGSGLVSWQWDGLNEQGEPAAPGLYAISAQAFSGNRSEAVSTYVAARVDSVSVGGTEGLTLNLAGIGAIDFSAVRQIQ